MIAPPLEWTIDVKTLVSGPVVFSYEATAAELDALRRYAEVEDLTSFSARLTVKPLAEAKFKVSGVLHANLVQASVVNLSAVPTSIKESFCVEYWPADQIAKARDGPETLDAVDREPIADDRLPIGQLLCELLAISIDPFPQNEGDRIEWSPPDGESGGGPFADLARRRQQQVSDGE